MWDSQPNVNDAECPAKISPHYDVYSYGRYQGNRRGITCFTKKGSYLNNFPLIFC